MMKRAVMLKGITSVIHRMIAAARRARIAFAFQERGISSPPLSRGSGDGSNMIPAIRIKANKKNPILYANEGEPLLAPPSSVFVPDLFPVSMMSVLLSGYLFAEERYRVSLGLGEPGPNLLANQSD
jgi:hypothetical protein